MTGTLITTRIALTLCFMALLMLVSLIPGNPGPGDSAFIWMVAKTPTPVQKILHVCLYGILALLWLWTLEAVQPATYRFLLAFIIAVAFGAAMEWCQTRVPGRFGTLYDVLLNSSGAAIGLVAGAFLL